MSIPGYKIPGMFFYAKSFIYTHSWQIYYFTETSVLILILGWFAKEKLLMPQASIRRMSYTGSNSLI